MRNEHEIAAPLRTRRFDQQTSNAAPFCPLLYWLLIVTATSAVKDKAKNPIAIQSSLPMRVVAVSGRSSYIIRARNHRRRSDGQAVPHCRGGQRQRGSHHVQ